MNCPKCGRSTIRYTNRAMGTMTCDNCFVYWTDWQQREIEQLKKLRQEQDELHLADEQSIRNMQQEIDRLRGLCREIEDMCNKEEVSCGPKMIAAIAKRGRENAKDK
jgi:hypothetical protein